MCGHPYFHTSELQKKLIAYVVDRTKSSRMGWSDVALSMNGPIVSDLVAHFVDRWYER